MRGFMKFKNVFISILFVIFSSCSLNVQVHVDIDDSLLIPKELALEFLNNHGASGNLTIDGVHWGSGVFYKYENLNEKNKSSKQSIQSNEILKAFFHNELFLFI